MENRKKCPLMIDTNSSFLFVDFSVNIMYDKNN
ncbi:hypothetical protein J2S74_004054 [Evansella vedderi]|uniref:Uncharacterized protein n=1 Tax=Evansella vedderi TaxID=38282 RepID=A0ABU0A0T6_9BACI|nr:hypothetical protein [Evansella vedderi]